MWAGFLNRPGRRWEILSPGAPNAISPPRNAKPTSSYPDIHMPDNAFFLPLLPSATTTAGVQAVADADAEP